MSKKIMTIELWDWEPYLSKVPESAVRDLKYLLYRHFSGKQSVTKKIHLIVEVVEE